VKWHAAVLVAAVMLLGAAPAPGPPVERSEYRYSRAIGMQGGGLTELTIDYAALSHGAVDDLRIVDGQNRQIPYVIERLKEPLTTTFLAKSGKSRSPSVSHYILPLPEDDLPPSELVLTTPASIFERTVTVVARTKEDQRREHEVAYSSTEPWKHVVLASPPPELTFQLPRVAAAEVTVDIEEGDNNALPLGPARLRTPTYRLRFYSPGGPLTLVYGNPSVGEPRYDLALLKSQLDGTAISQASLGPEVVNPESKTTPAEKKVFWAAIVLAILALVVVLAKLVR
jgi:hypothetical protein